MRILLAIIFPFISFFTIGRPIAGIICFILQCTIIAWLPAAIWAVISVNNYYTKNIIEDAIRKNKR